MTKQKYIESTNDLPIEEFPKYIWLDLNPLSGVRNIIRNEIEKEERIKEGLKIMDETPNTVQNIEKKLNIWNQ
jgi:hypothetical protein